jgi:hypothetical protein
MFDNTLFDSLHPPIFRPNDNPFAPQNLPPNPFAVNDSPFSLPPTPRFPVDNTLFDRVRQNSNPVVRVSNPDRDYWQRNKERAELFDVSVSLGNTPNTVASRSFKALPLARNGNPIVNRGPSGKILGFYTNLWGRGGPIPLNLEDKEGRQYSAYDIFGI